MAFTGAPGTLNSAGARTAVFTGISLAGGAAGTLTDNGGGGDIELPSTFPTLATLVAAHQLEISVHEYTAPAAGTPTIWWAFAAGTVTFTNADGVNATGNLEIRVHGTHSLEA